MGRFIGAYGALENACQRAADAALRQIPVFLNGEKGVGKETLARKIAKDANRPFQSLRASRLKKEEWTRLCEERELFFGRVLYLSELERVPKRFARRIVGAAMENALPFLLVASSETPRPLQLPHLTPGTLQHHPCSLLPDICLPLVCRSSLPGEFACPFLGLKGDSRAQSTAGARLFFT
ncbi:MAG: sigma 54-interacting transcriptional regulator [Thermoguttaceae bacterium]